MENEKVFRSRFSVLFIVILLAMFAPVIILTYKIIPIVVLTVGLFFFTVLAFSKIQYIISGDTLYFESVFYSWSVKISTIVSIKRSYNLMDYFPTNSTASFKKLKLQLMEPRNHPYSEDYFHVSPVREQEFIEILKTINPNIKVDVPDKKGIWRIWDWDI